MTRSYFPRSHSFSKNNLLSSLFWYYLSDGHNSARRLVLSQALSSGALYLIGESRHAHLKEKIISGLNPRSCIEFST